MAQQDVVQESKRGLSIYTKTLLGMLLAALLPVILMGVSTVLNERSQTSISVNQRIEQEAKLLRASVSAWADTNVRVLKQNAQLADIQSMDPVRQRPVLLSMASAYDWLVIAAVIDSNGNAVARNDSAPLMSYSDRAWFQQSMKSREVQHEMLIGKATGKPTLVLSTLFSTSGGGQGVLMTSAVTSDIADAVATSRLGKTGASFLLDEKGRVIAHPSAELSKKLSDLSRHPAYQATRNKSSVSLTFTENDKEYIAQAMTTKLGWVVVVQQEVDEAFKPVRMAIIQALAAIVVVILLTIWLAYILARGLSRPILRLTEVADAVSRGKTDVVIEEIERGDELGSLARAIDRMRASIELAMRKLRK